MHLVITVGELPDATLAEPDDCARFHVEARGRHDAGALDRALAETGTGWLGEGGDAYVTVAAVRRLAEGRVGDGWALRFGSMLDYAATKGWVSEAGDAIRAHVEWPD